MSSVSESAAKALSVEPLAQHHLSALAELFDRVGSRCYCRWWHNSGTKNDWLLRCASEPERNRAELLASQNLESTGASGLVAVTPEQAVVGWMKLAPARQLQNLYDQRLYRALPCFDGLREGVLTVGCFLVEATWRRHGIARRLLQHGLEYAQALGAPAVEAFPRVTADARDEELLMGPAEIFTELDFQEVARIGPYPVLRKRLLQ